MAKRKDTPFVDVSDLEKKVETLLKGIRSTKPLETTLKEVSRRAPGKVADAVRTVYNIKKTEITPAKKDSKNKPIGTIKARGETIATFTLTYEGRELTPLHFGMSPKKRPDKKNYKVTAKFKKGVKTILVPEKDKKVVEGGAIFLAPNPKKMSQILPWERISAYDKNASKAEKIKAKNDIRVKKTMSLPQMVGPNPETGIGGNSIVTEQINKDLGELLLKRLHHHLERHLKQATKE